MLLSDIFDTLTYGELSALALAEEGEMTTRDKRMLVNHINRGLHELHKRFTLKRGSLPLSVTQGAVRYVLQSPDDEILDVLGVLVEHHGRNHTVVQVNHPKYLSPDVPLCYMMLSPTVLRFNHPLESAHDFTVDYKAGHSKIIVDDFETLDPSKVEIDLPMAYLEALSFYVASRVIAPIDNNMGNPQEGVNYRALYEQACKDLEVQGLDIEETVQEADRFRRNGFV